MNESSMELMSGPISKGVLWFRAPHTHTVVCPTSVAGRCLKWFSHANSSAVVHWHPLPSHSFFSVRSFVNVVAKMFTRRAVQTGAFPPVTPFPTSSPTPETGPLHSSISGQSQSSIPQCISTSLPHVAFKPQTQNEPWEMQEIDHWWSCRHTYGTLLLFETKIRMRGWKKLVRGEPT